MKSLRDATSARRIPGGRSAHGGKPAFEYAVRLDEFAAIHGPAREVMLVEHGTAVACRCAAHPLDGGGLAIAPHEEINPVLFVRH